MGSAKDVANRVFHFIGGLVITIIGIIVIIIEFSSRPIKPTIASFGLLIFGLGWIAFAFDKHQKIQQQAKSNPPSIQAENHTPPIRTEGNPPPMNMS